ncbi:MAG TPA: molybdopterin-dependent oxidoreductase [Acidobacteriota bacterium]|nr:molybdopterin-dependent oxidoreductase [Acidobacteriota bacterium]
MELRDYPPPEKWDDWVELDAKAWPRKVERRYTLVPTICFNCEAACGLLAYVDKDTMQIQKFEGNPIHPGSRGKNCAKGPATINQIKDPERILYPLKRAGKRGEGKWARVEWDEVLQDIGSRIARAMREGRQNEIMYHVGRPGHERAMDRVLKAWGIDGHNSHTNICSASARLGYQLWQGSDRPSPDYANARFILLLSAHLESGHYFNPHAQRIIEGKMAGAKLAVIDPRLSNTASMADYWLPTYPGTESALLLAIANVLLQEELYDRIFVHDWVNWQEYLKAEHPEADATFDSFINAIKKVYSEFTPAYAEHESGIPAATIIKIAREIGRAGSAFAAHVWRSTASGNLGGWNVARCLEFLHVLTGSVGTRGGMLPNTWTKYNPTFWLEPPGQKFWNQLLFPDEYPLSHYEMSFLLPHFLKEGRGRLEVYFTRVYNPVWTNPDGFTWMEVLKDESKVGLHVALTPTWSETALFADYVLPMGHSGERHDIQSQETHAGRWVSFRQPVLRVAQERLGNKVNFTYEANPGKVWEEDEFWIELSWHIDPSGDLGIRKYFESPYEPGQKLKVHEYYQWIFENSVPGLPEHATKEGLTPFEYMRKYGAYEIQENVYQQHLTHVQPDGCEILPESGIVKKGKTPVGIKIGDKVYRGFPTPSRKLEFYSPTMKTWNWPEYSIPTYIRSHIPHEDVDSAKNEFFLIPTFRLPTMIHTRSGNSKWLNEISHRNPIWMHTSDAQRLGLKDGDLVKAHTEIGYFVNRLWSTEGIRPGVLACSHHMGRWRLEPEQGSRWASALVKIEEDGSGAYKIRQIQGITPFKSEDPDSSRIWWSDGGVHQNLTFPVHPDPISGMHCWHQKVRIEKADSEDRYGDIFVDTNKSFAIYKEWLKLTRPGPGPNNLRRPLWLTRPVRPADEMFYLKQT